MMNTTVISRIVLVAHLQLIPILRTTLLLCLCLVLYGCGTTTQRQIQVENRQFSFWPQFPDEPRVQFLVAYRYSSDIEIKKSKFEDLLYGEEASVLPINKPYGIAMWDSKIYVCDIKNTGLVVLDLAKHQTRLMTTSGLGGMAQPTDIAISADGFKYVADAVRGVIFVFDEKERHVKSFGHEGFKPVSIAIHGDNLYVCDFISQSVLVMDRKDGQVIKTIGEPGGEDGQFIRPLGIDVDADGYVYVSDVIKCRLQKFNPEGELVRAIGQISDTAGSFVRPKHIEVDHQGIAYVTDAAFDNVQMFNDEGQTLMFFGSGGSHPGAMNLPAGICVTEDNIEVFREYIHPSFDADRIVLVTNQFGPNKIGVYAVGQLREGKTNADIASTISDIPSGIQGEDDTNPLDEADPDANENPAIDSNTSGAASPS
jgi:hypothetical protein